MLGTQALAAMGQLGEGPDAPKVRLDYAKHYIDMLALLERSAKAIFQRKSTTCWPTGFISCAVLCEHGSQVMLRSCASSARAHEMKTAQPYRCCSASSRVGCATKPAVESSFSNAQLSSLNSDR